MNPTSVAYLFMLIIFLSRFLVQAQLAPVPHSINFIWIIITTTPTTVLNSCPINVQTLHLPVKNENKMNFDFLTTPTVTPQKKWRNKGNKNGSSIYIYIYLYFFFFFFCQGCNYSLCTSRISENPKSLQCSRHPLLSLHYLYTTYKIKWHKYTIQEVSHQLDMIDRIYNKYKLYTCTCETVTPGYR